MKFWTWGAMAAALGVVESVMVACGCSGSGSGVGGSSVSSESHPASSSSSGSTGAECAQMTTRQMCFDCCGKDLPMAYNQLVLDILDGCACSTSDGGMSPPCASDQACQMDCQTMKLAGACLVCLNNNAIMAKDPCVAASYGACQSDSKCSPMLDCDSMYCRQAM